MKDPICPYCKKGDNIIIEPPTWKNSSKNVSNPIWRINCQGFCVSCNKDFEVYADVSFHNSRKVKQDNRGYPY